MKLNEKLKAWATIRETARRFGITPEQCRASMQESIEEAWSSTDPAALARQRELFPAGKPTVEEFITVLSNQLKPNS